MSFPELLICIFSVDSFPLQCGGSPIFFQVLCVGFHVNRDFLDVKFRHDTFEPGMSTGFQYIWRPLVCLGPSVHIEDPEGYHIVISPLMGS